MEGYPWARNQFWGQESRYLEGSYTCRVVFDRSEMILPLITTPMYAPFWHARAGGERKREREIERGGGEGDREGERDGGGVEREHKLSASSILWPKGRILHCTDPAPFTLTVFVQDMRVVWKNEHHPHLAQTLREFRGAGRTIDVPHTIS